MEIVAITGNILTFTQDVQTNIKGCHASNELNLLSVAKSNFVFGDATSYLVLTQNTLLNTEINVSAKSQLAFVQQTQPRVHIVNAHSYMILGNIAKANLPYGSGHSMLELTQEAEATNSKAAGNLLSFEQNVSFEIVNVVQAENKLSFVDGATCYVL